MSLARASAGQIRTPLAAPLAPRLGMHPVGHVEEGARLFQFTLLFEAAPVTQEWGQEAEHWGYASAGNGGVLLTELRLIPGSQWHVRSKILQNILVFVLVSAQKSHCHNVFLPLFCYLLTLPMCGAACTSLHVGS